MDWENILYIMIFMLVSINAITFYVENFVPMGVALDGVTPVYLSIYKTQGSFSPNDMNSTLGGLATQPFQKVTENEQQGLWGIISQAINSLTTIGNMLFNLGTGYARLVYYIFTPFGIAGTGIATMIAGILSAPILIGFVMFGRELLRALGLIRF